MNSDEEWMQYALQLAKKSEERDEVPVGAIIVYKNKIIGEGWNQPISSNNPTAHAEIMALQDAGEKIGNYRLLDSTMYVTLEPCNFEGRTGACTEALIEAKVARVVCSGIDPTPEVAGKGIASLREAGNKVDGGSVDGRSVDGRRLERRPKPPVDLRSWQTRNWS